MANRTTNIAGRVLRNLRRYKITTSDVLDEDIYDEITQGINEIISEVQFSRIITITLETDVDTYPLGAGNNENNIASIKLLKRPEGWKHRFTVVNHTEFLDKVNACPNTSISQPVLGTVIEDSLIVYPKPVSAFNDAELKFWCKLKSSTLDIDKDTEPEIPAVWDKALEYFVTAQFLSGNDRAQYLAEYNSEVKRLRPIPHRDNMPSQSPSIWIR